MSASVYNVPTLRSRLSPKRCVRPDIVSTEVGDQRKSGEEVMTAGRSGCNIEQKRRNVAMRVLYRCSPLVVPFTVHIKERKQA